MLHRELIFRIYVIFAMLVVAFCGCISMKMNDSDDGFSHPAPVFMLAFIALIPGLFAYIKWRCRHRSPASIAWLTALFLWMIATSLLNLGDKLVVIIFQVLCVLVTLSALCTMYVYARRYGIHKHITWTSIAVLLILVMQYISIFSIANLVDEAHLITAYYPLFVLPLALTHRSRYVRIICMLVVSLVVISSIKRGGLVALSLGMLVYFFCYSHIRSHGLKAILIILLAVSVICIAFVFVATSDYGQVFERMTMIVDDGGSGRTDVWATTWKMIADSGIARQVVGHGANSVLRDSPLELSAHNDLLESWYDYGIPGLLLYIASLFSLVRCSIRLIKKKSAIAPQMAMMVTIMGILTLISHVLIYYFMTLCCMTFGLLIGQNKWNEHRQ